MMIGPNSGDSGTDVPASDDTNETDDGGAVLSVDEAMNHPTGRGERKGTFGAVEGQCDLGAGGVRWR